MTAVLRDLRQRVGRFAPRRSEVDLPPLEPRAQVIRGALVVGAAICLGLILQLTVVSGVQQRATQQQLFDQFREDLAKGTAPVGPVDAEGLVAPLGSPMAYLEIPAIGLRQVVVEGTTPGALFDGPGHRRDSPFPGQPGTSVILGRSAAFGGPFARIAELEEGDVIRTTTGQSAFDFEVIGVRREGDPVPGPLVDGGGRLLLITVGGRPFLPDGLLRVDAELVGTAQQATGQLFTSATLPANERMMATDNSTMWALVFWLQALLVLALAGIWSWYRWGRVRTWITFVPPLLLVSILASGEFVRLLPNLL